MDLTTDRDLFFVCAPYKKLEIEIVSSDVLDFRYLKDGCPTTNTNQVTGLYKVSCTDESIYYFRVEAATNAVVNVRVGGGEDPNEVFWNLEKPFSSFTI